MKRPRVASAAFALGVLCAAAPAATQPAGMAPPLIIGHRGAAGHLPEHTLAGYALAIDMGADYIEPDLVITKDAVLVARHENELSDTTDAAGKFPARRAEKTIDGRKVAGWFSEDFTLAEIKTLRAKERLPFRGHAHDGRYEVPTLEEVIALAQRNGSERGRPVGLYPETKHPGYFRAIGLPLEEPLLAALERHGLNRADAPVFIQSFEVGNLKALAGKTRVPLIQLIGSARWAPPDLAAAGDRRTYGDLVLDHDVHGGVKSRVWELVPHALVKVLDKDLPLAFIESHPLFGIRWNFRIVVFHIEEFPGTANGPSSPAPE